jgi:hypothetical protein
MIDAADISLRHMRIDLNHARQETLALFACLLLALTGALAASLQSIQRLPSRSSLHDVSAANAKSDHLTSNPRPTAQERGTREQPTLYGF